MTTIKEEAMAYEPNTTKNIAELKQVPVNMDVVTEVHQDKDGKDFTVKIFETNEGRFRIPNIVLGQLKSLLEKMPNLEFFSVIKNGSGLNTTYQVIPVTDTA